MYRLEVYKLWLGFLEKAILLLFATVVIPSVVGKVQLSIAIGIGWFIIVVALAISYAILSIKAKELASILDSERKPV